jgi:hypothetical protein
VWVRIVQGGDCGGNEGDELTAQERNKLRCAERQLYIVLGMCAGHALPGRERLTRKARAASDAALWRELFVLLGMCGCGW